MGLLKDIKSFRGIGITPISFDANQWNGLCITLLSLKLVFAGNMAMSSTSSALALFYCNKQYSKGGETLVIRVGIFFMAWEIYRKVLKPEKEDCAYCGDQCDNPIISNDKTFCSENCKEWQSTVDPD